MSGIFRELHADEIECRVKQCTAKGAMLLLYKDARCDMNILDEAVGSMNWQCSYSRDNANCIVSIYDKEKMEWVGKEDTGTESNTEAEKGLASDSFKRACFKWGIGRELYTAPFIWIKAEDCSKLKENNGKWQCFDKFTVRSIEYSRGNISYIAIEDERNRIVYTHGQIETSPRKMLLNYCKEHDIDLAKVAEEYHIDKQSTDERILEVLEVVKHG